MKVRAPCSPVALQLRRNVHSGTYKTLQKLFGVVSQGNFRKRDHEVGFMPTEAGTVAVPITGIVKTCVSADRGIAGGIAIGESTLLIDMQ